MCSGLDIGWLMNCEREFMREKRMDKRAYTYIFILRHLASAIHNNKRAYQKSAYMPNIRPAGQLHP